MDKSINQLYFILIIFFCLVLFSAWYGDFIFSIIFMLLSPYLDRGFVMRAKFYPADLKILIYISSILFSVLALVLLHEDAVFLSILILLTAAVPEEWFFRVYFQTRLGNTYRAIFLSSVVFSMAHAISISIVHGLLVFIPSLIFGYVFKVTNNFILVVLLHLASNLIYLYYIDNSISTTIK